MYLPSGEYSGVVRAVLRVYFMVVLLVVALIGDRCLHYRTKLRLLQGQQVSVTNMTGWLRGGQFVKATWQLRRIPGGFFGFFMVASAIIALVSDLAVSGLVKPVNRPSRCIFEQGLEISSGLGQYPSMLGTPFYYASTSQITSMYNGGILGIYERTDNNPTFSAQDIDVVGNWTCDNGSTEKVYPNTMTDQEIGDDLSSNKLIYDVDWQPWSLTNGNIAGEDTYQLVIMSVNAAGSWEGGVPAGSFDAKFAVDVLDDVTNRQKTMVIYQCSLSDQTPDLLLHLINGQINITSTINDWLSGIQGQLYWGFDSRQSVSNVQLTLTWMLNSMIMVAGSQNSISHNTTSTEGCIAPYTHIPWPISLLVSLVAFLGFFFIFYAIWLWIRVRRACREHDRASFVNTPNMAPRGIDSKEIKDNTPNSLIDWMQHAVHETGTAEVRAKPHHLQEWLFSTSSHRGHRMSVFNRNFSPEGTAYNGVGGYFNLTMSPGEQNVGLFASPAPSSGSNGSVFFSSTPSPPVVAPNEKRTSLVKKKPVSKDYAMISLQEVH